MCCNQDSGNSCNCGCETLVVESIAGPTGATGPAGTSVLYWNTTSLSTATTGSDVLLDTYVLLANELPTVGDTLVIEIKGAWLLTSTVSINRYLKVELNNPVLTVAQCMGNPTNGAFIAEITITKVSNVLTEGYAITHWNNGVLTNLIIGYGFVTDFTANQNVRVYVNQDTASAVRIDSIRIKKELL